MEPTADISVLLAKVRIPTLIADSTDHSAQITETIVDGDPKSITISNQPRGNETKVSQLKGRNLQSLGLKCVFIIIALINLFKIAHQTR